jgi:heme oxygenase
LGDITTLLDRIRTETRSAHDRIERAIDIERRTASLAGYRSLLARFYGFHSVWEPAAEPIIADPSLFRRRRKAGLLSRDLRVLGLGSEDIAALPRCEPLVPMPNRAAALGAMYVIEGSTLGGAIIARQVERRHGLTPEAGCSYFRSYGAATATMWKSFRSALLAASSPATDDEVILAAMGTFTLLETWLCGSDPT